MAQTLKPQRPRPRMACAGCADGQGDEHRSADKSGNIRSRFNSFWNATLLVSACFLSTSLRRNSGEQGQTSRTGVSRHKNRRKGGSALVVRLAKTRAIKQLCKSY